MLAIKENAEAGSWFQDFRELKEKQPTLEEKSQGWSHIWGKIRRRR